MTVLARTAIIELLTPAARARVSNAPVGTGGPCRSRAVSSAAETSRLMRQSKFLSLRAMNSWTTLAATYTDEVRAVERAQVAELVRRETPSVLRPFHE